MHTTTPAPTNPRTVTVTSDSPGGLRIPALWADEIAHSVATALGADADLQPCRLVLDADTGAPLHLSAGFRTAGHHVHITVTWTDLRRHPGYLLTVDGRRVTVDTDGELRPAVVLADAARRAITNLPRPPATPATAQPATDLPTAA